MAWRRNSLESPGKTWELAAGVGGCPEHLLGCVQGQTPPSAVVLEGLKAKGKNHGGPMCATQAGGTMYRPEPQTCPVFGVRGHPEAGVSITGSLLSPERSSVPGSRSDPGRPPGTDRAIGVLVTSKV